MHTVAGFLSYGQRCQKVTFQCAECPAAFVQLKRTNDLGLIRNEVDLAHRVPPVASATNLPLLPPHGFPSAEGY